MRTDVGNSTASSALNIGRRRLFVATVVAVQHSFGGDLAEALIELEKEDE